MESVKDTLKYQSHPANSPQEDLKTHNSSSKTLTLTYLFIHGSMEFYSYEAP